MRGAYKNCINLTTAACGPNVTNMSGAYSDCTNLTTAVCGPNVTDMSSAYYYCNSLTTAVCGPNVTNMSSAYYSCTNLTTAVCGDKVTDMSYAYSDCTNLTTAVCGPNVIYMNGVYFGCTNLTTAVCGPNVISMGYEYIINCGTYGNCPNIQGNSYFYSPNVNVVRGCFYNRNTSNMLNIYVQENSTTMNTCLISNGMSLISSAITWTNDSANKRYYNTSANIYIYPVANVYKAEETAMLQDFTYDDNNDGTYTLTGWKETHNGVASTEMIIPNNKKIIL